MPYFQKIIKFKCKNKLILSNLSKALRPYIFSDKPIHLTASNSFEKFFLISKIDLFQAPHHIEEFCSDQPDFGLHTSILEYSEEIISVGFSTKSTFTLDVPISIPRYINTFFQLY